MYPRSVAVGGARVGTAGGQPGSALARLHRSSLDDQGSPRRAARVRVRRRRARDVLQPRALSAASVDESRDPDTERFERRPDALGEDADASQVLHERAVEILLERLAEERRLTADGARLANVLDLADLGRAEADLLVDLAREQSGQDLAERPAGEVLHLAPLGVAELGDRGGQ